MGEQQAIGGNTLRVTNSDTLSGYKFVIVNRGFVMAVISAPSDWVESVGNLKLPPRADCRLQELMDRNADGTLSAGEREDLAALVELSETLSLVRAEALQLLGRRPS